MGTSLGEAASDLGMLDARERRAAAIAPMTLPGAFALACTHSAVARDARWPATVGWLENQVLAAIKAVPLGQAAGQTMLLALGCAHSGGRSHARRRSATTTSASFAPGWRSRARGTRRNTPGSFDPEQSNIDHRRSPTPARRHRRPRRLRQDRAHRSRSAAALRDRYQIAVVTNDIYTEEDAQFLVRNEALAADRIIGVETGGCPHTAIREDASINLEAVDRLARRFGNLDIIFVESGGDNLAATFCPELSDLTLYVIDVAAGDKIPRKGGPGITHSDLLIINKIDLAPLVGASLDVMDRDARRCAASARSCSRTSRPAPASTASSRSSRSTACWIAGRRGDPASKAVHGLAPLHRYRADRSASGSADKRPFPYESAV